jgi:hypothetical protein
MSNQKTNTPVKGVQNTENADSSTNNGTVSDNLEILQPEQAGALQVLGKKTTNDVFEKLEHGNKLRENFGKFKEKLDVCENFESSYNSEALIMTIQNLGTGAEIKIQSIPMILDFVNEKVIKAGKNHLKHLEDEIINFVI